MTPEFNATPHQAAEPAPKELLAAVPLLVDWLRKKHARHREIEDLSAAVALEKLAALAASPAPRAVAELGDEQIDALWREATKGNHGDTTQDMLRWFARQVCSLSAAPAPTPSDNATVLEYSAEDIVEAEHKWFKLGFDASEAAFKNFHRALCARFGYTHDEKDWRRDQVSLEEHIAKLVAPTPSEDARKAARYDWLAERPGFIRPHLNGQAVYVNWSGTRQDFDAAIDEAIRASKCDTPEG